MNLSWKKTSKSRQAILNGNIYLRIRIKNITRRNFISCLASGAAMIVGGLLKPVLAFADWNVDAFNAETQSDALAKFFPGLSVTPSDAISIGVHDLVENGAVVPIKVNTDLPNVESIAILVEKNPNPFIANFNLTPACAGFIATRIKVGEPSNITAIVKSDGKLFSASKFVEVIEGGC